MPAECVSDRHPLLTQRVDSVTRSVNIFRFFVGRIGRSEDPAFMGLPDVRRKASFIRPTRKPSRDERHRPRNSKKKPRPRGAGEVKFFIAN